MTCDYVDKKGNRCGDDAEFDIDFYHPDHYNYTGQPESPFPLQLCEKHRNRKITWAMIKKNDEILTRTYDRVDYVWSPA